MHGASNEKKTTGPTKGGEGKRGGDGLTSRGQESKSKDR